MRFAGNSTARCGSTPASHPSLALTAQPRRSPRCAWYRIQMRRREQPHPLQPRLPRHQALFHHTLIQDHTRIRGSLPQHRSHHSSLRRSSRTTWYSSMIRQSSADGPPLVRPSLPPSCRQVAKRRYTQEWQAKTGLLKWIFCPEAQVPPGRRWQFNLQAFRQLLPRT